jgi:26S proteasome regulatory subunit T3
MPNRQPGIDFFFVLLVVSRPDKLSGAEIAAICQEAGMHAVRKNRYVILSKDIEKGYKSNVKKTDINFEFYK